MKRIAQFQASILKHKTGGTTIHLTEKLISPGTVVQT